MILRVNTPVCTAITKKTLPAATVVVEERAWMVILAGIAQLKTLNKSAVAIQLNKVNFQPFGYDFNTLRLHCPFLPNY